MITIPTATGHVHVSSLPPPRPGETKGTYTARLIQDLNVRFEDPVDGTRLDCAFLDAVDLAWGAS